MPKKKDTEKAEKKAPVEGAKVGSPDPQDIVERVVGQIVFEGSDIVVGI